MACAASGRCPPAVDPGTIGTVLTHDTAIGPLELVASGTGLVVCAFAGGRSAAQRYDLESVDPEGAGRWLDLARRELDAYLDGSLREFTVPVDLRFASPSDRVALGGLAAVGYGRTTTYGDLALAVGWPLSASRAVGRAMATNPVAVVVPCHRVVGADGALVGYGGGLVLKRTLLDMESAEATPRLW